MKVIDNIRIVKLDNSNITWERYQEKEIGKKEKGVKREKVMDWIQVGGYYTSVESALESIIKTLKREMITNATDIESYLQELKNTKLVVEVIDNAKAN